jgi:hypothetical protein
LLLLLLLSRSGCLRWLLARCTHAINLGSKGCCILSIASLVGCEECLFKLL